MRDSYQLERVQSKFLNCASFMILIDRRQLTTWLWSSTLQPRPGYASCQSSSNNPIFVKLIDGRIVLHIVFKKLNFRISISISHSVFPFNIIFYSVYYLQNSFVLGIMITSWWRTKPVTVYEMKVIVICNVLIIDVFIIYNIVYFNIKIAMWNLYRARLIL